jgi:predicted nucleic acid-binding protein
MVVIADTSPLNYLVLIEAVEVLLRLYGRVVIPQPVLAELQHPDAPQRVKEWAALLLTWVEVVASGEFGIDSDLAELDAGEGPAIALAQAHPDALLLMDDVRGRKEAERRHIPTIGCNTQVGGSTDGLCTAPANHIPRAAWAPGQIIRAIWRAREEIDPAGGPSGGCTSLQLLPSFIPLAEKQSKSIMFERRRQETDCRGAKRSVGPPGRSKP